VTPSQRKREVDVKAPGILPMSPGQRRALAALLAVFLICVGVGLWQNPAYVANPFAEPGARQAELADRIDPNVADAATLAALPSMGLARAQAIVAYRERSRAGDSKKVVFKQLDDLMRVKGVGYALTRLAEPYLMFPITPETELMKPAEP
jgi:Helix-hairpin-helix motif